LLFRKGRLSQAFRLSRDVRAEWLRTGFLTNIVNLEYTSGTIYRDMANKNVKVPIAVVFRNFAFVLTQVPFVFGRAMQAFERSYTIAKKHGIHSVHGRSALEMGILLRKRNPRKSLEYLREALEVLNRTDLSADIERAKRELESLQ